VSDEWSDRLNHGSYVLVGGLLICGALLAIYYGLFAHHSSARSPAPTSGVVSPTPARAANRRWSVPTAGSRCDLPAGSSAIPVRALALSWAQVGQMSVPSASATYGPGHLNGLFYSCFAHNPTGALLAAYYYEATTTESGVTVGAMNQALGADQPKTLIAKYQAAAVPNVDHVGLPAGASWQIAGFKFDAYTPQHATITTLLSDSDASYLESVVTLVWTTDWKITGGHSQEPSIAPSGYVAWSVY
jgi:hypothetical protein